MPANYSVQELDEQKAKIKRELLSGISPSTRPHAYLLAGQPGAGKSTMAYLPVSIREISHLSPAMTIGKITRAT